MIDHALANDFTSRQLGSLAYLFHSVKDAANPIEAAMEVLFDAERIAKEKAGVLPDPEATHAW